MRPPTHASTTAADWLLARITAWQLRLPTHQCRCLAITLRSGGPRWGGPQQHARGRPDFACQRHAAAPGARLSGTNSPSRCIRHRGAGRRAVAQGGDHPRIRRRTRGRRAGIGSPRTVMSPTRSAHSLGSRLPKAAAGHPRSSSRPWSTPVDLATRTGTESSSRSVQGRSVIEVSVGSVAGALRCRASQTRVWISRRRGG